MYALFTVHDKNYQPLADLTWEGNKLPYAEKHGYATHVRTENFVTGEQVGPQIGFEKIYYAKELLLEHPEYEWIWWTGTDTMITNFGTRIEDRVSSNYHIILSVDINGLNVDSLLIRNSPEAIAFLDEVIALREEGSKHWDVEQWCISNLLGFPGTSDPSWPSGENLKVNDKYKNIVKLMPQRYMNSFNYQLYHYPVHNDKMGWDGNWQLGDWLIHWPACSLEYRIQLAEFYREYIIK